MPHSYKCDSLIRSGWQVEILSAVFLAKTSWDFTNLNSVVDPYIQLADPDPALLQIYDLDPGFFNDIKYK